FGAQLSKRGTLDVALRPGLHALLSYGEGFRSPQARSLEDGERTPFTRVVSYELGLRFRDERRLEASIAGFRTALSDDLVFDHATARNERVPGTTRTGIAAQLAARPASWFLSQLSFTYAHAVFSGEAAEKSGGRYHAGELVPYAPGVVVRSDWAFTPQLGSWLGAPLSGHFGSAFSYVGRRPLPYAEFGHDVFLVDASAEFKWRTFELGLEVFNLFDRTFYDGEFVYASRFGGAASLVPVRHVTLGPPRSFLFTFGLSV
ncbi:MAG TPA: TonB-dependent receptor, partial [Polyangiaceae bacterium]|nr:TonB-dependent receptor [Polyangiaceae bacterium]